MNDDDEDEESALMVKANERAAISLALYGSQAGQSLRHPP